MKNFHDMDLVEKLAFVFLPLLAWAIAALLIYRSGLALMGFPA